MDDACSVCANAAAVVVPCAYSPVRRCRAVCRMCASPVSWAHHALQGNSRRLCALPVSDAYFRCGCHHSLCVLSAAHALFGYEPLPGCVEIITRLRWPQGSSGLHLFVNMFLPTSVLMPAAIYCLMGNSRKVLPLAGGWRFPLCKLEEK